jgi:hypothetical protein
MNNINAFFSNAGDRNDVRMRVVDFFSKEEPGKGKAALASKYNYYVETLGSGNHVILTRPAFLHNGFDFIVRVENINFNRGVGRYRDNPSHSDIQEDLLGKRQENLALYTNLFEIIDEVYQCHEINDNWFSDLNFSCGYSSEMILKVIKWLFIEQDIRYWNYSGRDMFMNAFPKP